jgi:hypothetical protein
MKSCRTAIVWACSVSLGCGALALIAYLLGWLTPPPPDNRPIIAIAPRGDRPKYRAEVELDRGSGLKWTADLEAALIRGTKENKRVFIAAEGLVDANSLLNRRLLLNQKPVSEDLARYVLVHLSLDRVPNDLYEQPPTPEESELDGESNAVLLLETLDEATTPIYVIVDPVDATRFRVVGVYSRGRISDARDREDLAEFVRDPSKKRAWK